MWWLWVSGYVAGGMLAFRLAYLDITEDSEREVDACTDHKYKEGQGCQKPHKHFEGNSVMATVAALLWPVIGAGMLVWKIMFPRGAVTKYAKQKAVSQQQAAKELELEQLAKDIKKASKAAGLRVPEGL
jgi:hypothetical protein